MYRRFKLLKIVFTVIMALLVLRAAYIQILGHEDLSAAASAQQNIVLDGADTRGVIYDRNGTPLAGGNQEYIYIIKTENYDGETQNALNALHAKEVINDNNDYKVFTSKFYNKKQGQRLIRNSGAYILEADRRYHEEQPAAHMIGYINSADGSGASGLELMYNETLAMLDKKVSAVADVNGTILRGYGLTVESAADKDRAVREGIKTTLDLGVQKEVEKLLRNQKYDGAAIVVEAGTGEIIAAASTPVFDPFNIEDYMESTGGELINKVVQGIYPPGSVFKIVVAAAALEAGVDPGTEFKCDGNLNVRGNSVKCKTGGEKGHGTITFEQAFAYSCNCAFIKLAQTIGSDTIIEMAERMGLGQTVLEGFPAEQSGNVMKIQDAEGAGIANLAIGQGENLVTPLQVAAMTSIVANDGKMTDLKIINEEDTQDKRCIESDVAESLQKMMIAAAEYGTGKGSAASVSSGIKTGSAEGTQGGAEVVHGWMTGYIPADDPKYVITVFMEDGKSGSGSAGPVFSGIVDYMDKMNMIGYEIDF